MELTMVVLPTPGPPVMTRTLERRASRTASAWLVARVSPVRQSLVRVGRPEADAADVARQPIGVFAHHLHGVGAVGLVDAHGARRSDSVLMQEHHDLADGFLVGPARDDLACPDRADAIHLAQPVRPCLDDVEDVLAELRDQPLGIDGADAADHAGAEVFLDPVDRGRCRGLEEARLELLAMGAVVYPLAGGRDPFAGGDHGGMEVTRSTSPATPSPGASRCGGFLLLKYRGPLALEAGVELE
jgi:hypothetical protein